MKWKLQECCVVQGFRFAYDTTTFFQGTIDSGAKPIGSNRITFTTTAPGVQYRAVKHKRLRDPTIEYRPGWRRRRGVFGRGSNWKR